MTSKRMYAHGRRGPEARAVADALFGACVDLQVARAALGSLVPDDELAERMRLADAHRAATERIVEAAMRFTGVVP